MSAPVGWDASKRLLSEALDLDPSEQGSDFGEQRGIVGARTLEKALPRGCPRPRAQAWSKQLASLRSALRPSGESGRT